MNNKNSDRTKIVKLAALSMLAASASLTQQLNHLLSSAADFTPVDGVTLSSTVAIMLTCGYLGWKHLKAAQQSDTLAFVDPLTGLANRRQFDQRLISEVGRAVRHGTKCAVFYMDLDKFKLINDSYGHDAGDAVIAQFGARIHANLRGEDFVARLGGDEFAAIITNVSGPGDVELVAKRIFAAMSEPIMFHGKQIFAGVSIGATIVSQSRLTPDEALRRADFALFQAKESGRNNLQIFDTGMEETIRARGLLENDLREAIARDRFEIVYQPLVSCKDRSIQGVEAFVRWNHPERGLVPPSDFIPVAEAIGMIDRLGEIILRRACRETLDLRPIKLAVNVSSIQFQQRGFVDTVSRVLRETGFEANRLELEMTEDVFRNDTPHIRETLVRLRELGVRIAIDDFGTGLSSMTFLRDFPLDRIKIDRSLIGDIGKSGKSLNLVSHMIELGSSLGLSVTVEGVETDDQLRLLDGKGLTELQGYLFSRPLAGCELRNLGLSGRAGKTPQPALRLVG